MILEKLIDNFIKKNNGCTYDNTCFTSKEIKDRFSIILKKIKTLGNSSVVAIKNKNKIDFLLSILACMKLNIAYVPLGYS